MKNQALSKHQQEGYTIDFSDGCRFVMHGEKNDSGWLLALPGGIVVRCPHGIMAALDTNGKPTTPPSMPKRGDAPKQKHSIVGADFDFNTSAIESGDAIMEATDAFKKLAPALVCFERAEVSVSQLEEKDALRFRIRIF